MSWCPDLHLMFGIIQEPYIVVSALLSTSLYFAICRNSPQATRGRTQIPSETALIKQIEGYSWHWKNTQSDFLFLHGCEEDEHTHFCETLYLIGLHHWTKQQFSPNELYTKSICPDKDFQGKARNHFWFIVGISFRGISEDEPSQCPRVVAWERANVMIYKILLKAA